MINPNFLPVLFDKDFAKLQVYWKTQEYEKIHGEKGLYPIFCEYCLEISHYEREFDPEPEFLLGTILSPLTQYTESERDVFVMCVKCQKKNYDLTLDELYRNWED